MRVITLVKRVHTPCLIRERTVFEIGSFSAKKPNKPNLLALVAIQHSLQMTKLMSLLACAETCQSSQCVFCICLISIRDKNPL
jgi:hypothetical protein